jgi:putative tryptophan/tyrosine transport system substrate-binding protein
MRRRNFIVGLAATTGAWPLPVHAQQAERVRRVGILMPLGESDPQSQARLGVFLQMLRQIGWVEGKSIVFEKRFSNGQSARLPALAAQLLQANVDVIVTQAAEPIEALRHATATIPIVMASAGRLYRQPCTSRRQHNGFDANRDRAGHKAASADEGITA